MKKSEYIERYGLERYEQHKDRMKDRTKECYHNDLEYRESQKTHSKKYKKNYLNSIGKTKNNIRVQSNRILFDIRRHSKIKGYEIHHAFGYDDPHKFIYVPKTLHNKIHQFLRDNNIDVDSNHYDYIRYMINECTEYTYVSN